MITRTDNEMCEGLYDFIEMKRTKLKQRPIPKFPIALEFDSSNRRARKILQYCLKAQFNH